ncbi:MAG: hypothetical protein U0L18_11210 [Acutalibacteraceae bacterium]|jgi:hypothetical protein|nr:hypothetical protein [Acutalibacteraceae bacterium]
MQWIFFIVIVFILAIAFSRGANDHYHAGGGMFKNSEYNLNEKEKNISDVEYFNREGKMK